MKTLFLFIAAITLGAVNCSAQYFSVDTIKGESPYNERFSFIFPHLKSSTDQATADAINTDMVKDVLNMEYGHQKYSIFENIWGAKELDLPNVSNISFRTVNNDADFLSIKISATSCSASCNDWSKYYIYDAKSGKKIVMNDLLTGAGLSMITDSAYRLFAQRQNTYSAQLKDKIAKQPLSPEDKQAYQSAIDAYGKCSDKNHLWAALDKQHFYIYGDGCLFGELHYLDKVDYSFSLDIDNVRDYLTDYGKSILK
jgi:hypothetical protein